jgi:aminoglycoside N3'-acetyltransferase
MVSRNDICQALERLGIESGDICLFHSSFKSLGPVDGGAEAVIGGFEDAIGPDGTLVVPTL